jgi:hypothetical protein
MANTFTANQYPPSQSAVSLLERMRLAEEQKRLAEEERQIAAHKLDEARMTPGTPEYEVYRGGGDMSSYPIAELASMFIGGGAPRLARAAYQPGKVVTNIPQNLFWCARGKASIRCYRFW